MIGIIHPIKWPLFHAQNPDVLIFSADNILLEITYFFAIELYTIDFSNIAPIVMETTRNGTRHIAFNWIFSWMRVYLDHFITSSLSYFKTSTFTNFQFYFLPSFEILIFIFCYSIFRWLQKNLWVINKPP